jgi:hypothetical protein
VGSWFATKIDGLFAQVMRAYNEFCPRKIDFCFLTLNSCLDEILASNGGNTYSIPHMGKAARLQAGTLPLCVGASAHAMSVARLVLGLEGDDDNDDGNGNGNE